MQSHNDRPSEERCSGCEYSCLWSGGYGGAGGYPACSHPGSGRFAVNLLDEIDKCPKE